MLNEHHQTATCMSSTVVVALSVLARQTKRARLLVLGYPIGHRPDPLRVAEELATIDVISRGRLDMGFIKGVPYEFPCIEPEPGRRHGPLLGGARLHHQGDDQPRRAVQLGERALPLPPGEHLAAAVAAAASAGVEHHRQQEQCARAGRARLRDGDAGHRLQHPPALRRLSRGLHVEGTAGAARPTASPISGWSRSRTTRRRRASAASWSRAICAPAPSCIRRSAIRPAICRSRTTRG